MSMHQYNPIISVIGACRDAGLRQAGLDALANLYRHAQDEHDDRLRNDAAAWLRDVWAAVEVAEVSRPDYDDACSDIAELADEYGIDDSDI